MSVATIFRDEKASRSREIPLAVVLRAIEVGRPIRAAKNKLPLFCAATFDGRRTEAGALRANDFCDAIHAIVGDYDGEKRTPEQARDALAMLGIQAVIATSPSHKPDAPRWRVIAPLAKPLEPSDHGRLTARLNGVFSGDLAGESFTRSQSYYFGRVRGAAFESFNVPGTCIDELPELDDFAVGKDGKRLDAKEAPVPDGTLRELIRNGVRGRVYTAVLSLTARLAGRGLTVERIIEDLRGLLTDAPWRTVDPRTWQERYDAIPKMAATAVAKFGRATTETENAGPPSEDAVALAFVDARLNEYRYVPPWSRWLRWDGKRWCEDSTGNVYAHIRELVRAKVEGTKHERGTAASAYVAGVERLARVDQRIVVLPDQLDSDPWLLNTQGGIVDLRTGKVWPHDPAALCTRIAPCAVDPTHGEALWAQFLRDITQGDEELAAYLQRLAGYCATGDTKEDVLAYLFGLGANGKSSFAEAIAFGLGDYARIFAPETLMEAKGERHPTELAQFLGVRFALTSEPASNATWNDSRVKQLTGDAVINARRMRGDPFEFARTHKTVCCGNHMPRLADVTHAIRRRVQMVPFRATFAPAPGPGMRERLKAEAGGAILAWIVEGARLWAAQGTAPPACVRELTEDYLGEQDVYAQWISECCDRDPRGMERSSDLHKSYAAWCDRQGLRPKSNLALSAHLRSAGFEKAKTMVGKVFRGVRLKPI